MIDFHTKLADDIDTAILNGQVDEDLDALEASIQSRRQARKYPLCPYCEAPMNAHAHNHETTAEDGGLWRITVAAERVPKPDLEL